jgi:hypothetical protein
MCLLFGIVHPISLRILPIMCLKGPSFFTNTEQLVYLLQMKSSLPKEKVLMQKLSRNSSFLFSAQKIRTSRILIKRIKCFEE